ncbi:MAG: YaaR family protein [Treponema sp.]|nr:YaaR family protein [Treponema sp.]
MAKIDADPSLFMSPLAYANVKDEKKNKGTNRTDRLEFSRLFDEIRNNTAGELGAVANLPVCEEALDFLMDEVRSTGDALQSKPFPDEILRYKRAVRNFVHYVVKNGYELNHETGVPKFLKANYKGPRGTPEAMKQLSYTKIQVIDERLETLAAMLLSSQKQQIEIASRLEEITGLLVDLLQ